MQTTRMLYSLVCLLVSYDTISSKIEFRLLVRDKLRNQLLVNIAVAAK
jgi:hypothetical protein